MEKLSGLCVLLAALSQVVAGVKVTPAYFVNGGELKLNVTPAYSERITNILWKFQGNLLAEWVEDVVSLEMYRTFKGRTDLNMENGGLVIRRMSEADMGPYTVEINSKVHGESYEAQMIKDLSIGVKIEVVLRPLTCNAESERCNVSCDADITQAGPVTYSWKIGQRDWKVLNKDVELTKAENANDDTITCRISNPLSGGDSEPLKNPLYPSNTGQIVVGVVVVVIILLVAGLVLGVWCMWKRKIYFFKNKIDNDEPMTATLGNSSATTHQKGELPKKTPEEDGLLKKTPEEDELPKKTPDGKNGEGVAAVSCPQAPRGSSNMSI